MIDIKVLRNEPEKVQRAFLKRREKFDVEGLLELDDKRKETIYKAEQLKNQQNTVSKQIPMLKKEGKDVAPIFEEMKKISDEIKELDAIVRDLDEQIEKIMLTIPNIPNETVPEGETDEDNIEIRKWGEPTKFDFEPKAHWDIGKDLNILDAERAGKVTGTRFTFYKGTGSQLERAIINFFLDTHTMESGYKEVFPPYMVHRNSMVGTGQLPKFEEDAFKVSGTDYFLIPTADLTLNIVFPACVCPINSGLTTSTFLFKFVYNLQAPFPIKTIANNIKNIQRCWIFLFKIFCPFSDVLNDKIWFILWHLSLIN